MALGTPVSPCQSQCKNNKDELHVYTNRTCHKEFEALPENTNLGDGLTSGDKWLTSSDSA